MISHIIRTLIATSLLLVWPISFSQSLLYERSLVLVSGSKLDIKPLSNHELKKLFLGVPVYRGDTRIIPVRNLSDKMLYEVFLQKVIHMSADIYENRLLSRKFDDKTLTFFHNDEIFTTLANNHRTVSFVWQRSAEAEPRLKIVQTIWNGRQ